MSQDLAAHLLFRDQGELCWATGELLFRFHMVVLRDKGDNPWCVVSPKFALVVLGDRRRINRDDLIDMINKKLKEYSLFRNAIMGGQLPSGKFVGVASRMAWEETEEWTAGTRASWLS